MYLHEDLRPHDTRQGARADAHVDAPAQLLQLRERDALRAHHRLVDIIR